MCAVKQIIFIVLVIYQMKFSIGKPLFLNHSFITSLLGASSGFNQGFENNPYSENIANVPPKPQKLENSPEITFTYPTETTTTDLTTTSETSNIFQKKVNKIINKIVTISQIKHAALGGLQDNTGFQYPYTPDLDEKDIRINKEYGEPLKIDLTRTRNEKQKVETRVDGNLNNKNEENTNDKISPSTLGVFVLEFFAQLVGLTIGAANQISYSLSHNNTV